MASHYKLLFRGAVYSDQHPAVVRPRLQAMLKASDAQMDLMFSGKPVTIKKAVDEAAAERYLDAFGKAGAKLELVEVAAPVAEPVTEPAVAQGAPAQAAATDSPAEEQSSGLQLAEVGADLAPAAADASEPEVSVSTDHLSLANPGTLLGTANAAQAQLAAPVDTSHLELDKPGVRLGVPAAEISDAEQLLNFDFELGEVGEVLAQSKPVAEPELPDLSHLQLES